MWTGIERVSYDAEERQNKNDRRCRFVLKVLVETRMQEYNYLLLPCKIQEDTVTSYTETNGLCLPFITGCIITVRHHLNVGSK